MWIGPIELAAHLHRPAAVRRGNLLDAAADPVPRLEHDDVGAAGREVTCGGEAGEAGAEDEHVAQPPPPRRRPARAARRAGGTR